MPAASPVERPVLAVGECDPTVRHVGVRIEGAASGTDVDDIEIEDAEIAAVSLDGGRVTRLVLSNCTLRSVSLVEVDLSDGRLDRVEVTGSRWASCVVDGGTWEGVTLTDVRSVRLSARQATWRQVTFRDCDLTALDLSGARLDRVRFENCTMVDTEFAGATVKKVDFVECDLAGVRTIGSLRGATVDMPTLTSMAGAMAATFGVTVAGVGHSR
ncbi:pentapeptide repeat-containing protein [Jatrophihabitans sp. YIM 134969]